MVLQRGIIIPNRETYQGTMGSTLDRSAYSIPENPDTSL